MNVMKKSVLFIAGSLLAFGAVAQKANVVSAFNYMKKKKFGKAYEYIEKAVANEKTGLEAKTWYYRGNIILGMATSPDLEVKTMVKDPLSEGAKSFKKSLELDTKGEYRKKIEQMIPMVKNQALNGGIELFKAEKYEEAYKMFSTSAVFADIVGEYDTLAYFNAGIAADRAGKTEDALTNYQKCADVGYNGASIYALMADIHDKAKNQEKFLEVVAEGRKKYPSDQALVLKELNYYLANEKHDLAKTNLKTAIANEPKNELLHFALGTVHEALDEGDEAIAAYKNAIAVKADYFDAYYNLGAFIFNQGVNYNNSANELDFRTKKNEIAALEAKADEAFKSAIPFLEKAHEIDANDKLTMQSLSQLYVRMGMNDKYKVIKEKMSK
jgi:Tfp pilus assembly protein PilF